MLFKYLEGQKVKNLLASFLRFFLITSAIILIMVKIPLLAFFLALIWGAAFILSAFYLPKKYIFTIFAANMILLYLTAGLFNTVFYLAFAGIAVLVMTYMASENKGYYELQKWGAVIAVLSVSAFIGFMYFSAGDIGIKELEQDFKGYLQESLDKYEETGFFDLYLEQGITREKVEQDFLNISSIVSRHLPAFYYLQAIMAVFFSLLLASYVSQKRGIMRLNKKPFAEEVMPWQMVWLVILGLILVLSAPQNGANAYLHYAGSNLLAVMFPISVYYGISALIYRIQNMNVKARRWVIIFLFIATLIFSISILVFVSLVGLFDALLDYRKLNRTKEDVR